MWNGGKINNKGVGDGLRESVTEALELSVAATFSSGVVRDLVNIMDKVGAYGYLV